MRTVSDPDLFLVEDLVAEVIFMLLVRTALVGVVCDRVRCGLGVVDVTLTSLAADTSNQQNFAFITTKHKTTRRWFRKQWCTRSDFLDVGG